MAILEVDGAGNLWFMSMKSSNKNKKIAADLLTHLLFQDSKHSGFLYIYGIAEIINDHQKIDDLWKPIF